MGEIAEAMIWAEMNGLDPNDMSPEDWETYYEDQQPASGDDIAFEAVLLLDMIRDWDEDVSVTEALGGLFDNLDRQQCQSIAQGLKLLAAQRS